MKWEIRLAETITRDLDHIANHIAIGASMNTGKKLGTARDILRYFVRHPDAEDTLEGIAKWWFERERIERVVDDVHESLQLLVRRGLVLERRGGARQTSYRINPAKRKEVTEFIKRSLPKKA